MYYLLRNTRTLDYIALGHAYGAFRIWTRFYEIEDLPSDLLEDILELVAALWAGEIWQET